MNRMQCILEKIHRLFFVVTLAFFASSIVSAAEFSNDNSNKRSNPFKIQFSGEMLQLAATTKEKEVKKKTAKKSTKRSSRVRGADFDHLATGFPLSGAHNRAECATCHVSGVFKGTPTKCAGCHDLGRTRASTKKPSNHVQTVGECDQCHNTQTWTGARFDHAMVTPGTCSNCHNGSTAIGKPGGHISTTDSCDSCHSIRAWVPAGFNHSAVAPGTCSTCHNGSTATGKPGGHMVTTDSCDTCHTTRAWIPAGFNHSSVAPGTCTTCHNGSTATGKPGGHVTTNASCDACHTTRGWLPASFDHSQVAPGTCLTCHNGSTATGKPGDHVTTASCDACHSMDRWVPANTYDHSTVAPGTCITCHNGGTASGLPGGHFSTARSCDECHRIPPSTWLPLKTYQHVSSFYPGRHNSDVTCNKCHKANSEVIVYENTAYLGFCASCHGIKFLEENHKKVDTPRIIYLLDDTTHNVKDCRSACHEYEEIIAPFTTILKTRNNEHNVSDGGW